MIKTAITSLLLLVTIVLAEPVIAQNFNPLKNNFDGGEGDQITEMLDSLVNIRSLARADAKTQVSKYKFQPNEVPVYTEKDIRARLAKIQTQSPIPFAYNESVRRYIDLYVAKRRESASITMGLSQIYFPLFEQVLDQQNLPSELKYLAIVESALNPIAVSKAGATGLWQFMHGTGRMYNLEINSYIDERRDVYKSTLAACQYFKDMYAVYHDWLLVIASYNCGPGNINKAIARSGGKRTFWEIAPYLPKETRGYVPAFIAVNYMMNYGAEHNIGTIPSSISYYELDTVSVVRGMSFEHVAASIGVSVDLIRFLNPIYKKNYIPSADKQPFKLILPSNKVGIFIANAEKIYKSNPNANYEELILHASNTTMPAEQDILKPANSERLLLTIKIRKGDKLEYIADKYDCSVSELRKLNKLKGKKPLKPGQKIKVYLTNNTRKQSDVIYTASVDKTLKKINGKKGKSNIINQTVKEDEVVVVTEKSGTEEAKPTKYIYHIVQQGDTLWNISQRYKGVTVKQLKEINKITNSGDLKPGTTIKVVVEA
jgi:membrane-bound lytic murein transglycosylase D